MKKVLLVAVAGMFVLASCKKDYTCECTTTFGGMTATASATVKDTKKNATDSCEKGTNSATGTVCKIK